VVLGGVVVVVVVVVVCIRDATSGIEEEEGVKDSVSMTSSSRHQQTSAVPAGPSVCHATVIVFAAVPNARCSPIGLGVDEVDEVERVPLASSPLTTPTTPTTPTPIHIHHASDTLAGTGTIDSLAAARVLLTPDMPPSR
jgi:hypothetical protein